MSVEVGLRGLARTDAAKIRIIIDDTNFLAGKITQKWNSFTCSFTCHVAADALCRRRDSLPQTILLQIRDFVDKSSVFHRAKICGFFRMFNETSSQKAVPAAEINDSANRKNGLGDSFYGLGDRKNGRPNRKSPFRQ